VRAEQTLCFFRLLLCGLREPFLAAFGFLWIQKETFRRRPKARSVLWWHAVWVWRKVRFGGLREIPMFLLGAYQGQKKTLNTAVFGFPSAKNIGIYCACLPRKSSKFEKRDHIPYDPFWALFFWANTYFVDAKKSGM
jgi:hypothetical protein